MKVTIRSNKVYSAECANILGTAVARAIKKRRIVTTAIMLELQKTQEKRHYKKKQYWVAP